MNMIQLLLSGGSTQYIYIYMYIHPRHKVKNQLPVVSLVIPSSTKACPEAKSLKSAETMLSVCKQCMENHLKPLLHPNSTQQRLTPLYVKSCKSQPLQILKPCCTLRP